MNAAEGDAGTGVTMFRVSLKDRRIMDEVEFKGWTVRLADWLHLSNPDDPSRPTIGQVFKCYVSEEGCVLPPGVRNLAHVIERVLVRERGSMA